MKTIIIIISVISTLHSFSQGIINESGNIVCNGQINIILNDNSNWTDNGIFTSSTSDVVLIGNANQTISGTSNSSFYNLSIKKTSSDALLSTNIFVTNNLTITSGNLDLQNSIVDLQSTGVIASETESNRIKVGDVINNTGTIKYTRTINNVTNFDPANLGIEITTTQNLGSITVVRGHQTLQGTGTFAGNYGIARYYEIPGIGELDGSSINVKMHYWDAELGVNHPNEANLQLYQYLSQSGDNFWSPLSASLNTSTNTITANSTPYGSYVYGSAHSYITFNSRFTLGSSDMPLPIELLSFTAQKSNNSVDINWETSTEINNDYFILEKSKDAENWSYLSTIDAAGNSNTILNYIYKDINPYDGLSYYRLKQVDFNGMYKYSEIRSVNFDIRNNISIYPNPCEGTLYIKGDIDNNEILSLYNENGKFIKQYVLTYDNNINSINLNNLPKGTYLIKIENKLTQKIILK